MKLLGQTLNVLHLNIPASSTADAAQSNPRPSFKFTGFIFVTIKRRIYGGGECLTITITPYIDREKVFAPNQEQETG